MRNRYFSQTFRHAFIYLGLFAYINIYWKRERDKHIAFLNLTVNLTTLGGISVPVYFLTILVSYYTH